MSVIFAFQLPQVEEGAHEVAVLRTQTGTVSRVDSVLGQGVLPALLDSSPAGEHRSAFQLFSLMLFAQGLGQRSEEVRVQPLRLFESLQTKETHGVFEAFSSENTWPGSRHTHLRLDW
ncbi:hypothetical protein V5799_029012 [Amblyomma americanum]|uniref:Uncharacterized protein n=1 Tax=Amblyomma americanum TaxID=6943 RepID=A0AAQ4ES74_AMBAM